MGSSNTSPAAVLHSPAVGATPSHRHAGAYTRPLFSSTGAVSDTKHTLYNPYYPLTPPKHLFYNPLTQPLSNTKCLR